MEWKPATIDEVKEIVKADLKRCNADQVAVFQQYSVEPLLAPIVRNGKEESVVVVARNVIDHLNPRFFELRTKNR